MRAIAVSRMSEEEYLAFDLATEGKHEFVNGEVIAMAGASMAHLTIHTNLTLGIGNRLRGRPCRVVGSDARVRIDETGMYAYPDLTVYCGQPDLAPTNPPSMLNPKVIIEILSESTADYDRGAKAAHYRHRATVEAILFVDSLRPLVEIQTRNADGTWTLDERTAGEVRVAAIDVTLPFDEIYEGVELEAARA